MEFRKLLPEPDIVEVEELLDSLALAEQAPEHRPYTVVNFVTSVDGRAAYQGRSGALGDDGDRAIFHGLRERVDAVLAGTSTMRTERYGRILGKAERRDRRTECGLSPEPLAVVVTRSGDIPTEIPLFAEPEAKIVVCSPIEVDVADTLAQVELVRLDPGELTLTTVLRRLRSVYGVRALLCEGGPTLFGALLHEALVDELFLTIAPKLVGGGAGPTITAGHELSQLRELEVKWLLERSNSLYLRYGMR